MSFVSKLAKSGALPVHYVTCQDLKGRDCYYFIMSQPEKMKRLERLPAEAEFDLTEYGQVIASGFGTQPSAAVKKKLLDNYGLDESFIAKLINS